MVSLVSWYFRARVKYYCQWEEWKSVGNGWEVCVCMCWWGCYCKQFSITKINVLYQRLRRRKVRAHTYFFVGIYVFLAALLLWTHQCQLIDPALVPWLSPLDKKMLLNYIRSHDKIYSAVPFDASLPWFLWLHSECIFYPLFISFVFFYIDCSFFISFIFHLHPVQILTDDKIWAVNCWWLWNDEWLLIKVFRVLLWWYLRNMIMW